MSTAECLGESDDPRLMALAGTSDEKEAVNLLFIESATYSLRMWARKNGYSITIEVIKDGEVIIRV